MCTMGRKHCSQWILIEMCLVVHNEHGNILPSRLVSEISRCLSDERLLCAHIQHSNLLQEYFSFGLHCRYKYLSNVKFTVEHFDIAHGITSYDDLCFWHPRRRCYRAYRLKVLNLLTIMAMASIAWPMDRPPYIIEHIDAKTCVATLILD